MTREQYRGSTSKKNKKKNKKTAIISTALVLMVIAVLCVLSLTVFFKTENIEVSGNKTYSDSEVISASGIEIGDNLIRISDRKISDKLKKDLPFINSVKIERKLPSTVKIKVEETSEDICISNGEKIVSADLSGKVLKEYKQPQTDKMTLFTVSSETVLEVGKNIEFKNQRESELFDKYTELIKSEEYTVNFANTQDPFGSYIKIEDRMIVMFGSSTYFEEKLAYLVSSYPKISENATGIFNLSSWTPDNSNPRFRPQSIASYEN